MARELVVWATMPILIAQTGKVLAVTRFLSPEFSLRAGDPVDVSALGKLYVTAYPPGVAGATLEDATDDIVATFGGTYGEFWPEASPIIEAAGGLVCAVLTVRRAPWNDTPACPFIMEVFTTREQRRRGLARAALAHCLATIQAASAERVALRVNEENVAALALYTSLGFHPWDGQNPWRPSPSTLELAPIVQRLPSERGD